MARKFMDVYENYLQHLRVPNQVRHNPLWFGWDDAQIEKVAVEMGWRELPKQKVLAAVACSLVAEHLLTGNPLRYSRSQEWYARNADPLMAYRQVVFAIDHLIDEGLAEGVKGIWLASHEGRQSIISATPELIVRLTPMIDLRRRNHPDEDDVLVLRDKDGRPLPVPDTELTRSWRRDLEVLNAAYQAHSWFYRGRRLDVPKMRRIFNQDLTRGGRGYHHGTSYQQLSHEKREQITIDIEGVVWPTVERDYRTLHIRAAYAQVGKEMPWEDAYTIEGFDRDREVKKAFNTMINAVSEKQALGVIGGGLFGGDWNRGRELMAAFKVKHPDLVPLLCSDAGAKFQRIDSDMAMAVALGVLHRTGRPPLIIHDSFVVAECDEDILDEEMDHALVDALVSLSPKASTTSDTSLNKLHTVLTPSLLIHRGNTKGDQQGSVVPKPLCDSAYAHSQADLHDPGPDPPPEHLEHRQIATIKARDDAKKAEDVALGRDKLFR